MSCKNHTKNASNSALNNGGSAIVAGQELCPTCNARLVSGACPNKLCDSKYATSGAPSKKNRFRWSPPVESSRPFEFAQDFRKKYGIPEGEAINVFEMQRGDTLYLEWFDNDKWRGVFGNTQEEFISGTYEMNLLREMSKYSAETGVIMFDDKVNKDFETLRPVIINEIGEPFDTLIEEPTPTDLVPQAPDEAPAFAFDYDTYSTGKTYSKEDYEKAKKKFMQDLKKAGATPDDYLDFQNTDPNAYRHGIMTGREFAGRALGLYNLDNQSNHPKAVELARKMGVTLVGEKFCPLQPPKEGGDPNNIWEYTVDGQPIAGAVLDMNKFTMYCYPDDGRDHKHGADFVPIAIGAEESLFNSQNLVVISPSGKDFYVRGLDSDDVTSSAMKKIVKNVALMAQRSGSNDSTMIEYRDTATQSFVKKPIKAVLKNTGSKGTTVENNKPAVSEVGQKYLDAILPAYMKYEGLRSNDPRSPLDVNKTATAVNQIIRATRALRDLAVLSGVDRKTQDRISNVLITNKGWQQDFHSLLREFSILKQTVHDQMRTNKDVAKMLGDGFTELFGG